MQFVKTVKGEKMRADIKDKLSRLIILIICAFAIFTISISATGIEAQGLIYDYADESESSLAVVGVGELENTDVVIPSEVNGLPVTTIANKAFYDNTEITSLIIPDTITEIGEYAFHYCISLTDIKIGDGMEKIGAYAFYFCTALKNVDLGQGVKEINEFAFYNCINVNKLTIPNSVTTIKDCAFKYCDNLIQIVLGSGVTEIADSAFMYCYKVIETYNLSSFEKAPIININDNGNQYSRFMYHSLEEQSVLTWTEDKYVFASFNNKHYLVTQIGNETELVLPESFNGNPYIIFQFAFHNRTKLESVTFSEGVTAIGYGAFNFCGSLTSIELPNSLTIIDNLAFNACHNLKTVYMPDSVYLIGVAIFQKCYNLESVRLSDSLKSLEHGTFYECKSLKTFNMPKSLTNIGPFVFYECDELTKIIVPSGVTSIQRYAFAYCDKLTKVVAPSTISTIGEGAFLECPKAKIYCAHDGASDAWHEEWNIDNNEVIWGYRILLEDVFTLIGYSTDGKSICATYNIDQDALEEYNQITENKGDYGILFASYEALGGNNPLDENGNPIQLEKGSVIGSSVDVTERSTCSVILRDVAKEYYSHRFAIAMYTYENGEVKYIQMGVSSTVSGISCEEIYINTTENAIGDSMAL